MNIVYHPEYTAMISDWEKFRYVFDGGREFVEQYLQRFSSRETDPDFNNRKAITYAPAHAKAALLDIKNAVHQRMSDVTRIGGPKSYQDAINKNVDKLGNNMSSFMARYILPEIMAMGKVGIFVDRSPLPMNNDLRDTRSSIPYIYHYKAEDILSWSYDDEFKLNVLLLKEYTYVYKDELPYDYVTQYRYIKKTDDNVIITVFDKEGKEISSQFLELPEIPFVLSDSIQSLLTDVADYQIAALNLASSDMNYAQKSNFPFYTEQYHPLAEAFMRRAIDTSTENVDGEQAQAKIAKSQNVEVGGTQGRRYPKDLERPAFINPSPEPLRVSMEKQHELREEIRMLVGLNLASIQSRRASAESKQEDNRNKEEGLSNLGLELEYVENQIAYYWAMYEDDKPAQVKYPTNYSLRSEEERISEASKLCELGPKIGSIDYQKQVAKQIVRTILSNKVSYEVLDKIYKQVDSSDVVFNDPEIIREDVEAGLVDRETASKARLYPAGVVKIAEKEHAERLARIAIAQGGQVNASRGVSDGSVDDSSAKDEKTVSQRDVDNYDEQQTKTRGEGK